MNNFYNNTGVPNNGNYSQPVYNNQPNQYNYPQGNYYGVGFNNQFNYNQPINYGVNNFQPVFEFDPTQLEKIRKETEEKNSIKKSVNRSAGGLLIFLGISEIIVTIILLIMKEIGSGAINPLNANYLQGIEPITLYIINAIVSIIGMGIAGIVIIKLNKLRLDDVLNFNKVGGLDVIKYTFAGMAFVFIFNMLLSFMNINLSLFGFENNMPSYGEVTGVVGALIYYFTVAVVPPIAEEFIFRGAILGSLRKHGDAFAIIISAIFFGLAHGNFLQTPVTFLTGLVLGYITVKSNSIIPAIILHFVNNSLAVVSEFTYKAINNQNIVLLINTGLGLVFMVVGLICALLLIKKHKNALFTLEKSESQFTMSQKLRSSFVTPCMIIFTLYIIYVCVTTLIAS